MTALPPGEDLHAVTLAFLTRWLRPDEMQRYDEIIKTIARRETLGPIRKAVLVELLTRAEQRAQASKTRPPWEQGIVLPTTGGPNAKFDPTKLRTAPVLYRGDNDG